MERATTTRGADDIEFVKSRAESVPWKVDTARAETRRIAGNWESVGRFLARKAHEDGTSLITAYMHHVDAVLEFPSSTAWLASFWPEGADDALERMLIARYATAEQAEKFLFHKTLQGARIARLLGHDSLDPLLKRDLPLPPDKGGGTIRFADASVDALRAVMRALKEQPEPVDTPDDAAQRVARTRKHVTELLEEEPRYEALTPKARWVDDDVEVTVRAKGRARQALAAKFFDALSRQR